MHIHSGIVAICRSEPCPGAGKQHVLHLLLLLEIREARDDLCLGRLCRSVRAVDWLRRLRGSYGMYASCRFHLLIACIVIRRSASIVF